MGNNTSHIKLKHQKYELPPPPEKKKKTSNFNELLTTQELILRVNKNAVYVFTDFCYIKQ